MKDGPTRHPAIKDTDSCIFCAGKLSDTDCCTTCIVCGICYPHHLDTPKARNTREDAIRLYFGKLVASKEGLEKFSDLCKNDTNGWYERARKEEPTGLVCGWCGGLNDNYDDCGFFYLNGTGLAACLKCHNGKPGDKHRDKYGLGER